MIGLVSPAHTREPVAPATILIGPIGLLIMSAPSEQSCLYSHTNQEGIGVLIWPEGESIP